MRVLFWISLGLSLLGPKSWATFPFETCDSSNDYLEAKLRAPNQQKCIQKTHSEPQALDPNAIMSAIQPEHEVSCIATAMSRFAKQGAGYSYKQCASPESIPTRVDRPCISENYVRFTYDRLNAVSRCVFQGSSITTSELFPLLTLESGFHINVMSGSGCRGIGQLSGVAVREMDAQDDADEVKCSKSYTRGSLLNHAECAPFETELAGPRVDHSKKLSECEVTSLPENPTHNLFYSLRLYRMLKEEKASKAINETLEKLRRLGLTDSQIEQTTIRLARTMYNGGYPSIASNFKAFMASLPKNGLSGNQDKAQLLWEKFKTHLYSHYPASGAARRREVRDYVTKIETAVSDIEKTEGSKCF